AGLCATPGAYVARVASDQSRVILEHTAGEGGPLPPQIALQKVQRRIIHRVHRLRTVQIAQIALSLCCGREKRGISEAEVTQVRYTHAINIWRTGGTIKSFVEIVFVVEFRPPGLTPGLIGDPITLQQQQRLSKIVVEQARIVLLAVEIDRGGAARL